MRFIRGWRFWPLPCLQRAFGAEMMTAVGDGEGVRSNVVLGPAISSAATRTRISTGSRSSRRTPGVKVNVKTAGTSDEMVALMNEGGFDLVTASGDASLRLIAGKKVQPINIDLIPSWKTVDERLQNAPWHTVDGVHYGVPYQWGPNVLAYNTEVFKEAPKSWSVVFEEQNLPDGKPNKGRVQAFDGPIYIADAALYLMKTKPELGIKDPYELNEDQYKAALDLLRRSASSSAATGTTPWCRSTTSRTRASSPRRPGRSRSTSWSRRRSRSPRPSRRRVRPAGPTPP